MTTPPIQNACSAELIFEQLAALRPRNLKTMRAHRRVLSKSFHEINSSKMLAECQILVACGYGWFAYELVMQHKATRAGLNVKQIEVLAGTFAHWGDVDSFGGLLAGPAWLDGTLPDTAVQKWARSDDFWWRRAALVATTVLNTKSRGGTGDSQRTLEICTILRADGHDMVIKGVSWALRTLVVWDAEAVRAFLVRYNDVLAARIKREVNNKLRTGLKSG